jgi:SAM-dependent methyltransferase
MQQTPLTNSYNATLLDVVPNGLDRVIEVGCGSGALAREYKKRNPNCIFTGIELVAEYAEVAKGACDHVYSLNIESQDDYFWDSMSNEKCWIFGDVLEHLFDPWKVLRNIYKTLPEGGHVAVSVPNAQHWSVQLSIARGIFEYQESGLFDRTHIRWFTKTSLVKMFAEIDFKIIELKSRVFDHPFQKQAIELVAGLAEKIGANKDECISGAAAFQYVLLAKK